MESHRMRRQEDRSHGQLKDRLAEFGWRLERIARDEGEDFLASIDDEGYWSGLSFWIQLKSVKSIGYYTLKSGDVSYAIDVKHLLRWEGSDLPVFIVVWDISTRTGWWVGVHDVVDSLDSSKPRWRPQETVRVLIPNDHVTDDFGLQRIRWQVAAVAFPRVAKGKVLQGKMRFLFPGTPQARGAATGH